MMRKQAQLKSLAPPPVQRWGTGFTVGRTKILFNNHGPINNPTLLGYRLERKKGRLVDRFSDELLREKCGKKIDAGSLSLSPPSSRER